MNKFFELVKYSFFGAITTGINLILFVLFEYVGIHYIVSNTIAYFIAVFVNYIFNKRFVFHTLMNQSEKEMRIEFIKFIVLRAFSLLIDNSIFYVLVDIMKVNLYLSRIMLSLFIIIATYVINKLFIFVKREEL